MKLLTKNSSNYQLKKWPIQLLLLLTLTLVSLFLCYTSSASGLPSFHHSFNVYFSTCLISFFTRTLDKRYMFLICNGILAFLAKTSLSCYNSSGVVVEVSTEAEMKTTTSPSSAAEMESIDECVENIDDMVSAEVEREEEGKDAMEECLEVQRDDTSAEEEEEEIETSTTANEEIPTPNTEELNRKIEEFIRKMKEEIKINAQQQLVAV